VRNGEERDLVARHGGRRDSRFVLARELQIRATERIGIWTRGFGDAFARREMDERGDTIPVTRAWECVFLEIRPDNPAEKR